jgi:hypothetical protein
VGKGITLKELKRFRAEGVDMFLIDKLQKMRRANMEREKQFFSGLKHWGVQKLKQLVSQVSSSATKHGKLVTICNETFALLLYNNYIEKWVKAFQREEQQWLETLALPQPASDSGRRKPSKVREKGKYTAQKTGHCNYGGWSRKGMTAYNKFYHLVRADYTSDQAMDMERELLTHCMALKQRGTNVEGSPDLSPNGEQDAEDASVVEPLVACWDL